jgi:DnaJ-class molecular chaperone
MSGTERFFSRRQLSLKYHPDKNKSPDAEAMFVEVAEAYSVLSNADQRAQYDAMGRDSETYVATSTVRHFFT